MTIATPLSNIASARRRIPTMRPYALAVHQAMSLNRPVVFRLLSPAAVPGSGLGSTEKQPDGWDATNKAISSLSTVIGSGAKYYNEREQTKLLQQQADAAAARTDSARRAADLERQHMLETQRAAALKAAGTPTGMPAWVLPVAIGGVLIAGLGGYFLLKKKRA